MRTSSLRPRSLLAALLGAGAVHAAGGVLPLDAGTYVVASDQPCEQAPLAGVVCFDGTTFIGPHDSDCQTEILAQHGARYHVRRRCKALGDGTPTAPEWFVQDVRIESRTAFVVTHGREETAYALCPAFH